MELVLNRLIVNHPVKGSSRSLIPAEAVGSGDPQ